jgi:hypothetical protein
MDIVESKFSKIESVQLLTEMEPCGYLVDKLTGEETQPPKKSHKERTTIVIKYRGDEAFYGVSEPYGSAIYDLLKKHLETESQ